MSVAEQRFGLDERAGRILDAAADLLLRWGYRKVTVEDIARAAGVGKGTVYLHWKTKQYVFYAVLMRDGLELFDVLLDRMRADPARALPGRMTAETYLLTMGRPITRALVTSDISILGELVGAGQTGNRIYSAHLSEHYSAYLELLRDNGYIRADLDNETLVYLLDSVSTGFFLMQDPTIVAADLSHERRAELLADVVDRVLAPPRRPDQHDLSAIGARAIDHFDRMRDALASSLASSLNT